MPEGAVHLEKISTIAARLLPDIEQMSELRWHRLGGAVVPASSSRRLSLL